MAADARLPDATATSPSALGPGGNPDIEPLLTGDPDALKAYLREEYDDPEDDIEPLLWAAVAWGSAITNAPGGDELIDLPAAKALGEHAAEDQPHGAEHHDGDGHREDGPQHAVAQGVD